MYRAQQGPLNDSKVSRAEEGRVQRQKCCWKEVSPSTEQRMPVQQISARCASRISLAELEKTAHGGADGMRGEARRLLRGTLGPYQSVIAPTKPG
jgi:hypothetical protein